MASGGRGNLLPDQSVDPVSGQPGFKNNACRIAAVSSDWRAFLVRANAIAPDGLVWWSHSRVEGGWLHELAGNGTVDADALLPDGERVEVLDAVRGMRRIVVLDDAGRLLAALYVTRNGTLPARDWIIGQLRAEGAQASELLAGRPSTPAPDRGPIVCICHGIGTKQILAVARDGSATVEAVGKACAAGTNCGSCRPAIARLLREFKAETAEAS